MIKYLLLSDFECGIYLKIEIVNVFWLEINTCIRWYDQVSVTARCEVISLLGVVVLFMAATAIYWVKLTRKALLTYPINIRDSTSFFFFFFSFSLVFLLFIISSFFFFFWLYNSQNTAMFLAHFSRGSLQHSILFSTIN